jgi:hypothetical protein
VEIVSKYSAAKSHFLSSIAQRRDSRGSRGDGTFGPCTKVALASALLYRNLDCV